MFTEMDGAENASASDVRTCREMYTFHGAVRAPSDVLKLHITSAATTSCPSSHDPQA